MVVRFRSEAAEDVLTARLWYDGQRDGLGEEFVSHLPDAFPEIAVGHRRALLHRFPYALYYHVERDLLDVVACLHTRRSPDTWLRKP